MGNVLDNTGSGADPGILAGIRWVNAVVSSAPGGALRLSGVRIGW
jgi:hypothetical protein